MDSTEKNLDFAERLIKQRLKLPLRNLEPVKKKEVAEEAGISVAAYSLAENGVVPGEKVLARIAKYYGVSIKYLLGKEEQYSEGQGHPPPIQDPHGIFGQTHQLNVQGKRFAVTTHQPDNPYLQPMAMLTEILASGDPVLVPAIQANLRAFQTAIRKERQLGEQSQKIKNLEEECEEFRRKNDNLEERLAALERKLSEAPGGKCQTQDGEKTESNVTDPGKRAVG